MALLQQLQHDQMEARKQKDQNRLSILQFAISAVQNEQIEKKSELTDEEVQEALAKQVKKLQDSLQDFQTAGRTDLSEKTGKEIEVLQSYLPEQMTEEELREIIKATIDETGMKSTAELGKLMGAVMPKVKGRTDGTQVRKVAGELLENH